MTEHAPLILDVAGTTLNADDRRRLAHPLTGGVILFARNWENRAQLLQLTSSIKAVRDDLLIYEIMTDKQRKDYEEFMETDFSFEVPGLARFRVNAFNQNRGAAAVFRTMLEEVLSERGA